MSKAVQTSSNGGHRVAIDVGGTFIDFVLLDESSGEIVIEKQPSTPETLVEELMTGLERLPVRVEELDRLFHGTTVAINAVLQERGAEVGLLTTAGFRDVLSIGRGNRPEIYNFLYQQPRPLVARYLRRDVGGRLAADGSEVTPLDLDAVDREADFLVGQGVTAIAICFLHSYANPTHERDAAERVRTRHPEISVTASHEVVTEWREYERSSTTVLNAYIQPLFGGYVEDLTDRLRSSGYSRPVALMQSNGGVISAERGAALPIRTLESGPAGGVIGAQALAREVGFENVICTDVGGTSYDVALIEGGEILERTETAVARRPIVGPIIDIVSIGAGGGSIAWLDHRGSLKVGPQSAGARPGPACFGFGGEEPTVTDCHLLLGRLDPENFLGARMKLDVNAAETAVRTKIAEPLGLDLEAAADGILAIAETNMYYAIRTVTVERGLDPREFVIFAYGGGGGLFAGPVSAELEVPTVLIPRAPANFSAWGILTSDYREDAALTRVRPFGAETVDTVRETFAELRERSTAQLRGYGFTEDSVDVLHRADLRFVGQEYTITVPVDTGWLDDGVTLADSLRERFVAMHRQLYGHGDPEALLEITACRCRAIGEVARPTITEWQQRDAGEPRAIRPVYFRESGGRVDTPVFDRDTLARGQRVDGPAIVEEWTTTTIVPPEWSVETDRIGNLVLSRNGKETG